MKGRILAGKYRLVDELGRGGMGSVWRADHIELRSVVAVKLIDPTLAQSAEGRSRFLREARAAGALRSNHVVQVYDYGVEEDIPYLVMELLEGESLAARLERQFRLTLAELQPIVRQVGRALAKAHAAGIVHRDLKPENIFICTEGDSELIKVLDFGIAKVESNIAVSVQTQTGLVLGTPYYMSPEQAEGRRALDARSDLWSLGVIAYECLLGKRPFDGENLAQLILAICAEEPPVPSAQGYVPPGFDEWFLKAVARRVETRFPNIQELVDAFSNLDDRSGWESTQGFSTPEQGPDRLSAPSDGFLQNATGAIGSTALAPARGGGNEPAAAPKPQTPPRVTTALNVNSAPAAVPDVPKVDASLAAATSNVLEQTGPRRATRNSMLAPLVGGAALVFLVGAGVVWKAGHSMETPPSPTETTVVTAPAVPVAPAGSASAEVAQPESSATREALSGPEAKLELSDLATETKRAEKPSPVATQTAKPVTSTGSHGSGREVAPPSAAVTNSHRESAPTRPAEKVPVAPAESFCVVNAISGRLQRASAAASGSFPCYVHTLSGQLKRKN